VHNHAMADRWPFRIKGTLEIQRSLMVAALDMTLLSCFLVGQL